MSYDNTDPFAGGEKTPAVSFKDAPIGTTVVLTVTDAPKVVQSNDYETGEPAFWPANADGTKNPKQSVVVAGEVNGEARSLWAPKPSALFTAVSEAQKNAGQRIAPGGALTVTFSGEKPNAKNPRLNPQKLYTAVYSGPDAFGDTNTKPVAAAPAQTSTDPEAAMRELKPNITSLLGNGLTPEQIAALGVVKFQGQAIDAATVAAIAGLA